MAAVDPASAMVTWQRVLPVDFPLLTRSGAVADPARTGAFLRQTVDSFKLPSMVRVALNLNHLELKIITLPSMPEAELRQVIQDEAARESIFSYAGGPVAVAYQTLGPSPGDQAGKNLYLTATTPQEVVDSISAALKEADLKLLSVQPTLMGLGRLMAERYPNADTCRVLLHVMESSSEFYLWQGTAPLFWRYLTVGADQPEKLAQEVHLSLEHSRRRTALTQDVRLLTVIGQPVTPALTPDWTIDSLTGAKGLDLRGLALQPKDSRNLNFILPASGEHAKSFAIWQGLALLLIGGTLLFNAFLGWKLAAAHRLWAEQKRAVAAAKAELVDLQTMATLAKKNSAPSLPLPAGLRPDRLLEELRRIVPEDLRFQSLTLDVPNQKMQITGICLDHNHLKEFLVRTAGLATVKNLEVIETRRENNGRYSFHLNLSLEVTKP